VARIISTCLRVKPDERYASAGVMLREVQQLRRRLPSALWKWPFSADPVIVAGALAVVVLLILVYALISGGNPASPSVSGTAQGDVAKETGDTPNSTPDRTSDAPPAERSKPAGGAARQPFTPRPATDGQDSTATGGSPAGDVKTVMVTTYDGVAEVSMTKDGSAIGQTPYPLSGPLWSNHVLWLRRPGFRPRKVDVQINPNRNEFLFGLDKNEAQSDFGSTPRLH